MENQEKREIIERALRQFIIESTTRSPISPLGWVDDESLDIDALAEQAIVIPVRITHNEDLGCPYTTIDPSQGWLRGFLDFGNERGHFGTAGEALAIIVPLGE